MNDEMFCYQLSAVSYQEESLQYMVSGASMQGWACGKGTCASLCRRCF